MKKILLPFLAAGLVLFAACSGKGGDPKAVAKHFFEAIKTMNMEEAAKYSTKDSKQMLDLMKMGMSFAPTNMDSIKQEMAKQKIDFSEPVINGDEATVSVTVDGKDKTDFKMKKEEGEWKVAFDKNTLMQTGMEKMKEKGASPAELQDAEKAMDMLNNPDSLSETLKNAAGAIDSLSKEK